jgi:single-strand DNA-binding protein
MVMANFNRVILMGNLTRDPELKYLPSGTAVCEFSLAVNRRFKDREGNQRDETCFVDLSAFGRQGETIKQYMSKGRALLVEGRLKQDTWTAQDGSKRSKLYVIVDNFTFVGSGGGGRGSSDNSGSARQSDYGGGNRDYNGGNQYDNAAAGDQGPPQGEDIPF